MKFTFFSFLLTVLLTPAAQAGRAIVFMKDRQAFETARLPVKIQKNLKHLNTFIVEAKDESQLQALKNIPGVSYVEKEHNRPVVSFQPQRQSLLANVAIEHAEKTWGLEAIKAPQAWEKSGKGQGIRVLVLDTGIDPKHPSLKDNFEKGRDFTGISKGENFTDQTGHGTHVAGTVAAVENSTGFAGVAPEAKILAGRVCSEMGCNNVGVVEGLDWGVTEKVDVINLSLGSSGSSPAEQEAILRADRAGISVVAATGNYGIDKVLFPAAYPSVIAVGAVDRNMQIASFSQYGPEVTLVAPGVEVVSTYPVGKGRKSILTLNVGSSQTQSAIEFMMGTTPSWKPQYMTVVDCGTGRPEDFQGKDLTGKIALVAKTDLAFADQIRSAMRVGSRHVLIYNTDGKYADVKLFDNENSLFASAYLIDAKLGWQLKSLLTAGKNPLVSLQTIATNYFETFGTSMASPHVAGVVALIKAANKDLTPAQIKSLLMKTALPLTPNDHNKFGAGLVDAEAAVLEAQRLLK